MNLYEYLSTTIFYHNTLIDWLISIGIVFLFFFITKILFWLSRNLLFKITQKSKNRLDDLILSKAESPVMLGIMLIGIWIGLHRLHFTEKIDGFISDAYQILIIINFTWLIARIADGVVKEYLQPLTEKTDKLNNNIIRLLNRTLGGIIWVFGITAALNNVGINIGAILAGLGIGGIAFALAAQDTIKNIFAGFVIFIDRPFKLGDDVKIDSYTGVIEDIGLRSVRIRTYDKRILTISSSKVIDSVIENVSSESGRRIQLPLGLTYDTTPEKMELALNILKKLPASIPEIRSDATAHFNTYGDSSLNILFVYFIRKGANIRDTQSKVNLAILKSFNENGLNFAFPTSTIYIEK